MTGSNPENADRRDATRGTGSNQGDADGRATPDERNQGTLDVGLQEAIVKMLISGGMNEMRR
jgi:hypothetical protein